MLTPDFCVVLDPSEVGADLDHVAVLDHPAGEQGIDVQLFADLLGVNIFAFVAENRVAGFHLQLRHMGKAVDQGLGDAIAEEIRVRVATRAGEGDHSNGFDLRRTGPGSGAPIPKPGYCDSNEKDRNRSNPIRPSGSIADCRRQRVPRMARFGVTLQPLQVRPHIRAC